MKGARMVSKALVAASTKPILLSILVRGEDYGYQIIQRVKEVSGGTLQWADNMLYPVLHRLEDDGFVVSRWRISEGGRLRKYYQITGSAERFEAEKSQWMDVHNSLCRLWAPVTARG
jgi:DNA-binding PadR family transcriptional regulator